MSAPSESTDRDEPNAPASPARVKLGKVPFYLWPNLLSLDAAIVAVVWLWCFAVSNGVPILPILKPLEMALCLGLTVWLIYMGDRLIDGWRMKDPELSTPRHRFARIAFLPLALIWVAVAVYVGRLALFEIPSLFFFEGMKVFLIVGVYFAIRFPSFTELLGLEKENGSGQAVMRETAIWFVVFVGGGWFLLSRLPVEVFATMGRLAGLLYFPLSRLVCLVVFFVILRVLRSSDMRSLLPKEVGCGFIFALGVSFPVFVVEGYLINGVLTAEFLFFALVCVLNCVVISAWESAEDQVNDEARARVPAFAEWKSKFTSMAFVFAAIAAWLGSRGPSLVLLSVALSAALIGAIGLAEPALSKNLRRVLVDVAMLAPLVIVPIFG